MGGRGSRGRDFVGTTVLEIPLGLGKDVRGSGVVGGNVWDIAVVIALGKLIVTLVNKNAFNMNGILKILI